MTKLIFAILATALIQVSAAEITGSEAFEKQRVAPATEKDTPVLLDRTETYKSLTKTNYQMFDFNFIDWNPSNLHWNPPSNMAIHSDGSWFIYAKHLANMRRLGGVFDTGDIYTALVNVTLYDGPLNEQKQCTGSVVHSRDYHLASLDYKHETWDVTARGVDEQIAAVASRVRCGSATRWWR